MSLIEVKGTKAAAPEADASQRYVLKSMDRKSKAPIAFGLFLTGVALYLKSIFPSWASPEEAPAKPEPDKEGAAEPAMAQAQMLVPVDAAAITGTVPPAEDGMGSGGRLIDLQLSAKFILVDTPEIGDFFGLETPMGWEGVMPSPLLERHANDNVGGGGISIPTGPGGADPKPTDPVDTDPGTDPDTDPGEADPDTDPGDTDPGGTDPGGTDPEEHECPVACTDDSDNDPCDEDDNDNHPPVANRAPRVSGPVYLMDVTGCAILAIGLTDLLRNAHDPDGDALAIENLTVSSGTLTQSGEGWIFQGGPQLLGPVTVTYQITDGELAVDQSAHFSVVRSYIEGTDGDDTLLGSMCADEIDGGSGDDNIDARAGNDIIAGGSGDDHIVAGDGDDTVFGGAGDDIIFGGKGNDLISGGEGSDRLFGEEGDDIVFGDGGDDRLSGGEGNDILSGGSGGDIIHDGAGEDVILGEAGNDQVIAALDNEDDVYDGGEGSDTLDYSETSDGVTVDLSEEMATGAETGTDTVLGFESAIGGSGEDAIIGSAGDDTLYGNAGDDEIDGGAGDDLVEGGAGDDLLSDGEGQDEVYGGDGSDHVVAALDCDDDVYDGGEGSDTLDYSETSDGVTVDLVNGSASGVEIGEDSITGFETLLGGEGDDHFIAGEDPVVIAGGGGENMFEFAAPQETVQPNSVLHEIMDFEVGDRIRMSKYDIFEEVFDELEDRFEDLYGDDIDDDDVAIRYRHDRTDEWNRTIIEADFNNDDTYETTINLQGHHVLVIVEHA